MNAHKNKLIVRRYFDEILLNGRIELIEDLFAPEICGLVRNYALFATESFSVSSMAAEGNTVMARWQASSLLDGQFDQHGFAVCYLKDGLIVALEVMDCNGTMRQIGAEAFSPEFDEIQRC